MPTLKLLKHKKFYASPSFPHFLLFDKGVRAQIQDHQVPWLEWADNNANLAFAPRNQIFSLQTRKVLCSAFFSIKEHNITYIQYVR